jgi:hypothetical protein
MADQGYTLQRRLAASRQRADSNGGGVFVVFGKEDTVLWGVQ